MFKGNKVVEPDVAEFVSAMAAGSCAKFMVEACAGPAGPTTLALVAAARQTGGRVVCIVRGAEELRASEAALWGAGVAGSSVELVAGDARALLSPGGRYGGADFVLVDCAMEGQQEVFRAAQEGSGRGGGGVVVGYNAFHGGGGPWNWRAELLPIGEGLRVSRERRAAAGVKKSRWVVRVDEETGEEHAFRVTTTATARTSPEEVD